METELSAFDTERYDRQMIIPGWGTEGQKKLKSSKAMVAGAGGLGCPVSIYLAAAGVGNLTIIDNERFELSNLNRQILGWQKDIGRHKVEAVAEKLRALNPDIEVHPIIAGINDENVDELIRDADVVVDAMDNWITRFILNRACVRLNIPFVHAGISGLGGQMTTILSGKGPCLQCIIPEIPEDEARFPVLGAAPGLFATLQVIEVCKLMVGIGKPLVGTVLAFDGWDMSFIAFKVDKRIDCPVCGHV